MDGIKNDVISEGKLFLFRESCPSTMDLVQMLEELSVGTL
jgi:hypothetical protein